MVWKGHNRDDLSQRMNTPLGVVVTRVMEVGEEEIGEKEVDEKTLEGRGSLWFEHTSCAQTKLLTFEHFRSAYDFTSALAGD